MNTLPLVSVLITAYNREEYIAEAIESVLNQTFENFELVIVDDCSSDGSFEIARQFSDSRIRLYKNEKNLGQFGNRNNAATLAKGQYIKYLDSDDTMSKDCLMNFVAVLSGSQNIGVVIEDYFNLIECNLEFKLFSPSEIIKLHMLGGGVLHVGPTFLLIKKSSFFEIGGFKEDIGDFADTDLLLNLALNTQSILKKNVDSRWRVHEGQITSIIKQSGLFWLHAKQRFEIHEKALVRAFLNVQQKEFYLKVLKINFSRLVIFNLNKVRGEYNFITPVSFEYCDLLFAVVPVRMLKFLYRENK